MTFTSTLLAVLAGIAIWQIIIFIGFSCGLEDNDYFLYFITCFLTIPFFILILVISKLTLFILSKLFVQANFYAHGQIVNIIYVAKKNKKLFNTDTKSDYYVTFEEKKFKSLPKKDDLYHRWQKYSHNEKIGNYLKKKG